MRATLYAGEQTLPGRAFGIVELGPRMPARYVDAAAHLGVAVRVEVFATHRLIDAEERSCVYAIDEPEISSPL